VEGQDVEEYEEIRYEGITILYEAEWYEGDEEYEVYAFPSGQIAGRHEHEEEEHEEGEGGDGPITEKHVDWDQVPEDVADTLKKHLDGKDAEELELIRYEGLDVLYEAEYHDEEGEEKEAYVHADGVFAEVHEHE